LSAENSSNARVNIATGLAILGHLVLMIAGITSINFMSDWVYLIATFVISVGVLLKIFNHVVSKE